MNYLAALVFCFLPFTGASAFGIGDWENITPSGNRMDDSGGGTRFSFLRHPKSIEGIQEWYFYQGSTIGKLNETFFIADEKHDTLLLFDNEKIWQKTLARKKLIPLFWTRWYRDNWIWYDSIVILLVLGIPINLIFFIFVFMLAKRAIGDERLDFKKRNTFILCCLLGLFLLIYLLDSFPQSI